MRSVFAIDDDPIHLRIAQMILQKSALFGKIATYTFAGDALSVIEKGDDQIPDVILLDLNMPVMNGWDFLQRYAEMESSLGKVSEIYIVTSSVDENDKLRSMQYPFVKGFISKPISLNVLTSHLESEISPI